MQTHTTSSLRRVSHVALSSILLGLMLFLSACGASQTQQRSDQARAQLDQAIQRAQQIGVHASALNPIAQKEQQIIKASAPFPLFNDQASNNFYTSHAQQFTQLLSQVQDVVASTTSQSQLQAQNDVQVFQKALAQRNSQHIGNVQPFIAQYNANLASLSSARYPKDFALISQQAQQATQALGLMGEVSLQLNGLKNTLGQMSSAHLDITAMQTQYQSDMQDFNTAVAPPQFENLVTIIKAQYQQAVIHSIQAIPYVAAAKLSQFLTQINLLKTYGIDASSYTQRYQADSAIMSKAKSIQDYLNFSQQIDADISSMHNDLVQGASSYLIGELDRQARAWGQAHSYYDKTDGNHYILDAGYTTDGIGYWLNRELSWAYLPQDYQAVVNDENNEFFNFKMMQQDYTDRTPYNQVHATDLQLISHYNLTGQVIVVSMVEEAMRIYQNGKLVTAFYVTTGRVERPSLPGYWTVQNRQSPTEFKSDDPPSSPFWYPPTPIKYAILYHWGGFFIHDAWWRVDFGPGTQFPHNDAGGTTSFNYDGSHGCINMQSDQAAWVYSHTDWNTSIVVY